MFEVRATFSEKLYASRARREDFLRQALTRKLNNEGLIPIAEPELEFYTERFGDWDAYMGKIRVQVRSAWEGRHRLVVVPWQPAPQRARGERS